MRLMVSIGLTDALHRQIGDTVSRLGGRTQLQHSKDS